MTATTLIFSQVPRTGMQPVYETADDAGGNAFANDGRMFLHVKNAGAAMTMTFVTPGTVDGLAVDNVAVAIGEIDATPATITITTTTPGTGGADEVQTIEFGEVPVGGTFQLEFDGETTGDIAWFANNDELVARILSALETLTNIGSGNVEVAEGTMTAGIGTITVTFVGALAKTGVAEMTVADNSLVTESGERMIGPFAPNVFNDASGLVQITYSGGANATVALLRL